MVANLNNPDVFVVTCDEPSHADRPYIVAVLEPHFYGPNGVPLNELEEPIDPATLTCLWSPERSVREGEVGPSVKLKRGTTTRRALTGRDEIYDKTDPDVGHSKVRGRFTFKCDLCGLSMAHRAENLDPIFAVLLAHGINTISLKALIDRHRRATSARRR